MNGMTPSSARGGRGGSAPATPTISGTGGVGVGGIGGLTGEVRSSILERSALRSGRIGASRGDRRVVASSEVGASPEVGVGVVQEEGSNSGSSE